MSAQSFSPQNVPLNSLSLNPPAPYLKGAKAYDLHGTPGAPKKACFGPKMPGAWGSLVGPRGPYLVPPAAYWPDRDVIMVTTHVDLVSGLAWATKRAPFGPKCPFWRPRRSSEGQIWSQLPPFSELREQSRGIPLSSFFAFFLLGFWSL